MPQTLQNVTPEFKTRLRAPDGKTLLSVMTCGAVGDGKSTVIGQLRHDCRLRFGDQSAGLEHDSTRFGMTDAGHPALMLSVDGLASEREPTTLLDIAAACFSTDRRAFTVTDIPGHEQYTRHRVAAASTADAAVLLVDAGQEALPQTRHHGYLLSLLGVRHLVLAVNKMDLVDWDQATFARIAADYRSFAEQLGIEPVTCIPISALTGDNISRPSAAMPWYQGPTLLGYLETVEVERKDARRPFRFPVQSINHPHSDVCGCSGVIAGGQVRVGDRLVTLPTGKPSRLARIVTDDGERETARAGEAVTLVLEDEIDVSPGDLLAAADARPEVADQFAAHLVWMDDHPLLPGRSYLLRTATTTVNAQVTEIKHRVNVNTFEHIAAKHLECNDIAVCNLSLERALPFDPYRDNRVTGSFVLIDRLTKATVGGGLIDFALRRASNIHHHSMKVDKQARAAANGQRPGVLWFTGLSGSGKSTVADLVEQRLHALGHRTMTLDGDNVRHGLNRDLGFTDEDRVENIRRVAEVAKLMVEAGLIVCVSFISPFRSERRLARERLDASEFLEIFVDAPLDVCEARDPKGLYKKARAGEIPNFTGIGSPYEPPEAPELRLEAGHEEPEALAERVIGLLRERGMI